MVNDFKQPTVQHNICISYLAISKLAGPAVSFELVLVPSGTVPEIDNGYNYMIHIRPIGQSMPRCQAIIIYNMTTIFYVTKLDMKYIFKDTLALLVCWSFYKNWVSRFVIFYNKAYNETWFIEIKVTEDKPRMPLIIFEDRIILSVINVNDSAGGW